MGRGAAGGRPPHMRAVRAAAMAGCTALARRAAATDGARPPQPSRSLPRYSGASRPPRASAGGTPRAWPDHAGAEGPPNAGFSSTAGRFAEARRATARDGVVKNAQVVGRASGVCCERGWAAGLAAGRRAGAHRPCARGRGDTGRRTESCPPRPTRPMAPARRSLA